MNKYLLICLLIIFSLLVYEGSSKKGFDSKSSRSEQHFSTSQYECAKKMSSPKRRDSISKYASSLFAKIYHYSGYEDSFVQRLISKIFSFIYIYKYQTIVAILLTALIIYAYTIMRIDELRRSQIKKILENFLIKTRSVKATKTKLNEAEIKSKINWFMNSNWKVQFSNTQKVKVGEFRFTLTNILKRQTDLYEFSAQGYETDLKYSKLYGILMVHKSLLTQKQVLSIFFQKEYQNKIRAGQTGKRNLLLYHGVQEKEELVGEWYYDGFKEDKEYSGQMKFKQV